MSAPIVLRELPPNRPGVREYGATVDGACVGRLVATGGPGGYRVTAVDGTDLGFSGPGFVAASYLIWEHLTRI